MQAILLLLKGALAHEEDLRRLRVASTQFELICTKIQKVIVSV